MKYPIQKWKPFKKKRKKRSKRDRKPIPRIVVPSFFTLMNLFCGFLAIISISEGRLTMGAGLIVFAGLFDALDGFMARLANSVSQFGIELDSISDIVSFGAAPGFLLYTYSLHELSYAGILLSALPPLCGAVRLARFNVEAQGERLDHFKGLPIPAQAIILASFYLTFYDSPELFQGFENGVNAILLPAITLLSFLMVSTLPFDKIPIFSRTSFKKHKNRWFLFLGYLILILAFQEIGLMIVFTIFVCKGLVLGGIRFWRDAFGENGLEEDEETFLPE